MKKNQPLSNLFASAVLIVSFVGFSATVSAGPQHKEHKKMGMHQKGEPQINMKRVMRHLSKIDLTDEQKTSIKALIKESMEANKPKNQQMKALHMKMKGLRKSDTLDEQSVRDISFQIAQLKSDLMISRHKNRQAVKALLTDEQRQKLEEMKGKSKGKDRKNKKLN